MHCLVKNRARMVLNVRIFLNSFQKNCRQIRLEQNRIWKIKYGILKISIISFFFKDKNVYLQFFCLVVACNCRW